MAVAPDVAAADRGDARHEARARSGGDPCAGQCALMGTGFASVIVDVDSTLCGIEGIDWLAALRGSPVEREVAGLTDLAMAGEIALDAVYGERLAIVRPTRDEVAALAKAYQGALAPGAESSIRRLSAEGRRVVLVSGGLREAILPVATRLGIAAS